jgi:hypothetical protein
MRDFQEEEKGCAEYTPHQIDLPHLVFEPVAQSTHVFCISTILKRKVRRSLTPRREAAADFPDQADTMPNPLW